MTLLEELTTQVRRYDDEAWSALASKGLLRRAAKDLAADAPNLVEATGTKVSVGVGDHVVLFDARGPAQATCSCPAAGVCQHIVTAGLWLASQESDGDAGAADQAAAPDLHAQLMAMDEAALVAHAGRPGYRWALQFVADQDAEAVRVDTGAQVLVGFAAPRVTFRYMGGGVDSVVADVNLPAIEKHRAAAVLAYQRAHGAVVAAPAARASVATSADLTDARRRFRDSLARLLVDTVRLGVSHLSPAVHQRYETLAVWAQGVEYHRLALLLRRLADQVELLLSRSARADEHQLLDQTALAFALVTALDRRPDDRRLVGQARNRYAAVRSMSLIGLGGLPWVSATGYHGLTCLFWWPEESRFVSWTDARPESVGGFDPRARYTQPGPWAGLPTPAAATGMAVRLTDAQLSAGGRLSGVERTQAAPSAADLSTLPVIESWSGLGRHGGAHSLLDLSDPLRDWVLLRPAAFTAPFYDPIRQSIDWLVQDAEGEVMPLRLRWTRVNAHAVHRVESLGDAGPVAGTVVVARMFRVEGAVMGEPISLLGPDGRIDALHFDGPPADPETPLPPASAGQAEGEAGVEELPSVLQADLPAALRDLRLWLVRQAERGTGAASAGVVLQELAARHAALRGVGFTLFPSELDADPAVALLRTHYLYLQAAALLT